MSQSIDSNTNIRLNPFTLAFRDHSLEDAFLENDHENSIKVIRRYFPSLILLFLIGLIFVTAVPFWNSKIISYFLFAGSWILLILFLVFRYIPLKFCHIQPIMMTLGILFGYIYCSSFLILDASLLENYVFVLVITHIVTTSLGLPCRFVYSFVMVNFCVIGFVLAVFFLSNLSQYEINLQLFFLLGLAGICHFVVYQRETAARVTFFQKHVIENREKTIEKYSKALNDELEKGRKIQRDFLPGEIPQIQNCDIATYFHPALQLSGDFYDVFTLPDNRIGLVIADVSDKGVGSALFMALFRSLIRVFSGHPQLHCSLENHREDEPIALKDFTNSTGSGTMNALNAVSLTNEYIAHEHGEESMFATLFFGAVDPLTGSLSYINGGHEPLIIVGEGGIKKRLKPTGPAVGMMPGASYKMEKVQLEKGDILFGYTDGVTEARSPMDKLYTRSRLENSIESCELTTSASFLENIKSKLFDFIERAPQSDDITMIAVRWG